MQDRFPGQCHPVRYEDMVADPDTVAARIFGFLGAAPVSDIYARAFSLERERTGPGDYKIWATAGITAQSAGRGWSIPATLIGAPVRDRLSSLTGRLGYVAVDDNWGGSARPSDLRLPGPGQAQPAPAPRTTEPTPAGASLLGRRLRQGIARLDPGFPQRWPAHASERFALAALSPGRPGKDTWWQADLAASHVQSATPALAAGADWVITAPAQAWEQVIRHHTNLGVAFRRLGMRYTSARDAPGSTAADTRAAMMSELLGASTWQTSARRS